MTNTPADSASITQADIFAVLDDVQSCPRHHNEVQAVLWRRGKQKLVFSTCGCVWDCETRSLRVP